MIRETQARRIRSVSSLSPLLVAIVLFTGTAVGCGGSDEGQAIESASVVLNGLGVSGGTPLLNAPDRKTKYEGVIKSLKSIAESGSPARAATAHMLIGRGHAGLGEMASLEAARAESNWLGQASEVRSLFDRGVAQKVVADALASYDPSKELADLDNKIREREQQAAEVLAAKQRQVEVVNQIKARAEETRSKVQAERQREIEVRARAQGATQTTKAQIIEEANQIKRKGDEFEKIAAAFDADAAKEAPEVETIQSNVNKFNRQVELMREAKKSLTERAAASQANSAEAAKEARESFQLVSKSVETLNKSRVETNAISEEAIKAFQAASTSVSKAAAGGKEMRSGSAIAKGNFQQSIGDVAAARARSLKAHAVLLGAMAKARQGGVTSEQAAQAQEAYVQAREQARAAYAEAEKSFSGSGVSGELGKRLTDLAARISKLSVDDQKPAPAAEDAPRDDKPTDDSSGASMDAPVEKPAPASSAPPADFDKAAVEAEARELLCRAIELFKKREFGELTKISYTEKPEDLQLASTMTDILGAGEALGKACKDKYGKDFVTIMNESQNPQIRGMAPMMDKMIGTDAIAKLDRRDCQAIKIEAKDALSAQIFDDLEKTGEPSTFRKIDGKWLMDLTGTPQAVAQIQQLKAMKPIVTAMSEAFTRLTEGVRTDKLADIAALEKELSKEMMGVMMKAGGMGGGGGGGKPGGGGGGGGG